MSFHQPFCRGQLELFVLRSVEMERGGGATNRCSNGEYAVEPRQTLPPAVERMFTERQFLNNQQEYSGI